MKILALIFFITFNVFASSDNLELMAIEFDLSEVPTTNTSDSNEVCQKQFIGPIAAEDLIALAENPRFWSGLTGSEGDTIESGYRTFYYFPTDNFGSDNTIGEVRADNSERFLGMTQREALLASRDPIGDTTCSTRHIHDNIANRWCHGYIANNFANFLRDRGLSHGLATLAGGIFWVPKEYFKDLNPSANDIVITHGDHIDNRVSYQVSIYGDMFFPKRPGQDFELGAGSLPIVTLRVCLGSDEACARRRNR
ncbi:MAG: hypothetical protein CME65_03880 [Halobacteriovoraceae bacterium]|nr:hypothetical protein [Halobacteriovoraceae bacterium]|tara:strand:- start:1738 stop:2496 length:759 start_codon:yes stop_codon:yes gene_type:complete